MQSAEGRSGSSLTQGLDFTYLKETKVSVGYRMPMYYIEATAQDGTCKIREYPW